MITKTEVQTAIARSEYLATNPLDRSSVSVERGDLTVLIEAAKRARYVNAYTGAGDTAPSDSGMRLADEY